MLGSISVPCTIIIQRLWHMILATIEDVLAITPTLPARTGILALLQLFACFLFSLSLLNFTLHLAVCHRRKGRCIAKVSDVLFGMFISMVWLQRDHSNAQQKECSTRSHIRRILRRTPAEKKAILSPLIAVPPCN